MTVDMHEIIVVVQITSGEQIRYFKIILVYRANSIPVTIAEVMI